MRVLIVSRVRGRVVPRMSVTMVPHPVAAMVGVLEFLWDVATGGALQAIRHNLPYVVAALALFIAKTGDQDQSLVDIVIEVAHIGGLAFAVSLVGFVMHGILVAMRKRRVVARRQQRRQQLASNSA